MLQGILRCAARIQIGFHAQLHALRIDQQSFQQAAVVGYLKRKAHILDGAGTNLKGSSNSVAVPGVLGVMGESTSGRGVVGVSTNGTGVWGQTDGAGIGVAGSSKNGIGVHGKGGRLAGFFDGDVEITGDLLTTSATPGHAMAAADVLKAFGIVIGKALCPLKEGQGLIPILISLQ